MDTGNLVVACTDENDETEVEDFFTEVRAIMDLELDASLDRILEELIVWKEERDSVMI